MKFIPIHARKMNMPNFVKTKHVAHAQVCRDIKSKVKNKSSNNPVPDSSKHQYQKIVLRIPDEYAFALMEMYGKGLQGSIMRHIKSTVNPLGDG